MKSETRVIKLILISWLTAIVGLQIYIYLLERNYSELLLNELTVFNLPVHFWLTGQFLPLWFIVLCVLFNLWMDRHTSNNLEGTLRFRVRPLSGEKE
ncbi:MAG: hypothetical protein A2X82_09460 [Geobacteraceae bacterium GWC2_55_20]|nr:MAG: hypothetical protein A2X82_09460 [Geobacteraceae bacterium GWC2_55_20]